MQGLMMKHELMISDLIEHAATVHKDREIYTLNTDLTEHRYTWNECAIRVRKLANALLAAGVKKGDRIATIAWNNYRHVEIYYAVSSIGAIVHTINPRLKPQQIAWMINHAEDTMLMFDTTFGPIIDGVSALCPTVKKWVCLTDNNGMPEYKTDVQDYESFIAEGSETINWERFDENTACTLCYTSGTTGDPKGVLYSHRSTILHAMAGSMHDVIGGGACDSVLAVVPMFHVSAWGLVYSAAMVGAKLVLPGPGLDGPNMCKMITQEEVTLMAGVPTVWLGIYNHAKANGIELTTVKKALVGGSALPESLLRAYELDLGIPMQQGWGMTETSPLGVTYSPYPGTENNSFEDSVSTKLLAGRRIFGVDMRIVDDEDNILPQDGKAEGHLHVRGPWISSGYFKGAGEDSFTNDGWFRTGDVAVLHPTGYLEITDRSKDVIKSGGEWVSSIEVENAASDHPEVAMAACIGITHEKWQERPFLIVQPVPGKSPDKEEIKACIAKKCAKWWLPDEIVFQDELPLGATGKILKRELKTIYKDHYVK
ncbi:fatty-acyl-CoA synthase [Litorimonas taeanensis]|uniref:3-methylmercaptopropionyl-CoA ligase n=1 Tax=Litorimonas taeanensis TaxID=568099 RepID=A0A420WKM0_9PROT|nr:long-chain fatty acid--CoA ligase [Litorimonas taeanensis]RKQ71462.1 fatty-acyl-CoA synthase [Litorimonas taeanensis]